MVWFPKFSKERGFDKPTTHFKYSGPAIRGTAYALFSEGLCFRVVRSKKWFLYNDTLDREMHINFSFDAANGIYQPKRARTIVTPDVATRRTQCTVVVYPLESIPFVNFTVKKVVGFSATNKALPLSENYIERTNQLAKCKYAKELVQVVQIALQCHTEEEILYKCRKTNVMFVDLDFKPDELSLQRRVDARKIYQIASLTWKRPQDYIPSEAQHLIKVFRAGINSADIAQGNLADCWLMCSVAVVADNPAFIKDMFQHPVSKSKRKKENRVGAYRVCINKCGWWRNLLVDSYLPTHQCLPRFARSRDDPYELWVSLLEKAYAKVHGSYASIIAGHPTEALQDLTGFPSFSFGKLWAEAARDKNTALSFFNDLRRYRKKGYLIYVNTPGKDTSTYNQDIHSANDAALAERLRSSGLNPGHAYSVLKVRSFFFPELKLLQIRNPWGTGMEWTGDWGKYSDKWKASPLVRRACKLNKESDGTFWMEWKDVVSYFDGGGVCLAKKSWFDYRFQVEFRGFCPSLVLRIELRKTQKVIFTFSQEDHRMRVSDDKNASYEGICIVVSQRNLGNSKQEVVAISTDHPEVHPADSFTFQMKRDVGLMMELDAKYAPYYVIPRIVKSKTHELNKFILGMLTPVKSTSSGLRVSFHALPEACPIFQNARQFDLLSEKSVNLIFQVKQRGRVPQLKIGTTLFDAKYVTKNS